MGMGVAIGGGSVGRPTRMADPVTAWGRASAQELDEIGDSARSFAKMHLRAGYGRQTGAVVPPIFQTAKTFHQDRFCFAKADIANDAAHGSIPRNKESQQEATEKTE